MLSWENLWCDKVFSMGRYGISSHAYYKRTYYRTIFQKTVA